ncbi:MAG: hypothetical protein AAFN68_06345, partial [Pseudomonadota bacterium]
ITNAGNTAREISLQALEDREDPFFTYDIEPTQLRIPSMTTAPATLTATPTDGKRRAWFGKGHQAKFRLVVADQHSLPLPEAIAAEALWERRPWWHLALALLLGAGLLGAIAGLFWWLFLRQLAPPKILDLTSTASTYYQQQDDFVRLTWQIENPQRIKQLELRSETQEGAIAPDPITYDFSQGVPAELSDTCVLAQQLNCSNVFTAARQPGRYRFTLAVLPKGKQDQPITAQIDEISILSAPPPKVEQFATTQARYWEAISSPDDLSATSANQVALNWKVTGADELSHLTLIGRLADGSILGSPQRYDLSNGLPETLKDLCTLSDGDLTCTGLLTKARTVGKFVFELNLFTTKGEAPIATAKTEPVEIVPVPVRIESFTINGETAPAKYSVQLRSSERETSPGEPDTDRANNSVVQFAWRVTGGPYTKVELLPSPGSVFMSGSLRYPLSAGTREVVTLQVTSVSVEKNTRSVTFETF